MGGENKMGMMGTIYQLLIMAGSLAVWELFLKTHYYIWVQSQTGMSPGFGHVLLGYVLVLASAKVFVYITAHRMESEIE